MLNISVIIPVFNAEQFIKKSVESVLNHTIVKEIVLIEDGSTDNSYHECERLLKTDPRIKLYTHLDNSNRGAAESRNLGITMSSQPYIAFLDADDFYLKNRFDYEIEFTNKKNDFDGVFGALGFHYYNDEAKAKSQAMFGEKNLTTVQLNESRTNIFEGLLGINKDFKGYFHLDALTIKKSTLNKMGYHFNNELRLHQDTEFIIRYAYYNNLVAGNISSAIGLRGVHDSNRITSNDVGHESRYKLYASLYDWSKEVRLEKKVENKIQAEYKIHRFLWKKSTFALAKLILIICSNQLLFLQPFYFRKGMETINLNPKIKNLIIRSKEKFVLLFFKTY